MKKIFWIALAALLVACAPAGTAVSPAPTPNSSPIIPLSGADISSVPSALPSKAKTTASLKTPAPTSMPCFDLTRPANGAHLSETGKVEFAWANQGDAQLYILSLISPEGLREDSRTTTTTFTRSIKAGSKTGVYYWSVTAYDGKGDLICNPGFIQFTRGAGGTDGQATGPTNEIDQQAPGDSVGADGIKDETDNQPSKDAVRADGNKDETNNHPPKDSVGADRIKDETDNRPSYGSGGNSEPGIAGIEIAPSFPEPTIKPSDIENIEIVPPAPPIKPPERFRAIIADLVRDGIQEKILVERAALSQYAALPFELSLLRIASHINLAQSTGTFSVLSVPVEVVLESQSLDLVPPEPTLADIAATLTEELIVPPTKEPPLRWKPPATEPAATEPPLRWKPPATEPPATEPPLRWKPPATEPAATEPPLIWKPPATEPPATEPPSVP